VSFQDSLYLEDATQVTIRLTANPALEEEPDYAAMVVKSTFGSMDERYETLVACDEIEFQMGSYFPILAHRAMWKQYYQPSEIWHDIVREFNYGETNG
jgi:hypothetical protein